MFAKLFVLFVAVPLIELALLIQLGDLLGFWVTIGLVFLTGFLGAALAKSQGRQVLRAIRAEMAAGRVPAERLLDGLFVLIGGILLLTPGVLTDLGGLLLLFPPTRSRLKVLLKRRIERMVRSGQIHYTVLLR